jgi:GNAT superfamily N-acetyltransferase
MASHDDAPVIRAATLDDIEACHDVMWMSVTDFGRRNGTPLEGTAADWWASDQRLQRFLATHAAEWWVAEEPGEGTIIGYGRSIERYGLFELTEFFVLPTKQSRGIGKALIERAFPAARGDIRSIIATTDARALRRYYAAGTAARFPILTLVGSPAEVEPGGDLRPLRLRIDPDTDLEKQRDIERSILGFARAEDEVRWLLQDREAYLYVHADTAVGFAFVGKSGAGPIAALDPVDLPDILLHIEGRAASLGMERLELQVPSPNESATRHLLSRGFRIDPWVNLLMSDRPFGRFDRHLGFGPPVFL